MSDSRGRDGGFRSAGRNQAGGRKPGFGDKRGPAPRGEKPAMGDRRAYGRREDRPGAEGKTFTGRREYTGKGDLGLRKDGPRRDFADRGPRAPRGDRMMPGHGPARMGDRPPERRPLHNRPYKPANLAPRRVALETLLDVSRSDAFAALALDKRMNTAAFSRRDRAFVTQLVYGTLENRIALDWRIDQFLDGDKALDPVIREILRMGAYQLFYLDRVPDMAAVDESVSLTRAMGMEALTGLVNAVLRSMIRGKDSVVWPKPQEDAARYLSVMFSAPPELAQLLIEAYGEHGALEILRYRPKERAVTIRVNGLRCDDARLRSLLADDEIEFEPGIVPGTYKILHAGDLTRMRAFQNGLFTIQGESSVIAARAVGARPGQTVLDACAAPGGKTAVLSEMMSDTGRVYAWDTHAHRVELIRGTASRLKLENVRPAVKDAAVPRPEMAMTLDAALIDAPCSGTGVMLEKPDVKYRVSREGVESLCRTQAQILDAIAPMVKVGGTLVYSTCSLLPAENEEQIRAFLARHGEYEAVSLGDALPQALAAHEGELGIQMLPYRDGTDGFYVCKMRRVRA